MMEKLPNIHPGEVLKDEFLDPLGISAYRLAKETFIPQTRISEIIKKRKYYCRYGSSTLQIFWNQRQILA